MIRTAGFLLAVAVLAEWLAESFTAVDAWPLRFAGMLAALAAAALYVVAGAERHLDDRDDDVELPAGRIPVAHLLDRERREP